MVLIGCKSIPNDNLQLKGDYFGFEADTISQKFGEGIISTGLPELNAAFSPDGKEFFYSLTNYGHDHFVLVRYVQKNGLWQGPEVAPFSGKYSDADPFYSPDGEKLYFISRRPLDEADSVPKDFDIWYVEKENGDWGRPVNVGLPVNSERSEYYVSVTRDYTLYYSTNYEDPGGQGFIHRAKLVEGKYQVEKLGEEINDTGGGDVYVSPDEDLLIFGARGDLHVSFKVNDMWTKHVSLGNKINSESYDYCPIMSPDGKYFFFTSFRSNDFNTQEEKSYTEYVNMLANNGNGAGDVYWIKSDFIEKIKAQVIQQMKK